VFCDALGISGGACHLFWTFKLLTIDYNRSNHHSDQWERTGIA
jgi:hypothetical protein